MHLTVLGSGCSVPSARRSGSGYFLDTSGGKVLLDCSPSAVQKMADHQLEWAELDAIWISHFHLDHVGGLAPFLFSLKHAPQTEKRTRSLTIFGPAGIQDLLAAFEAAGNYRLFEQRFPVTVVEVLDLETFAIGSGVEAVALKTPHTDQSHALHIRDGGSTLVFTSDTGMEPALASIAHDVDLLLLECSFVRNKPVKKHLELAEAMHLIRKARPKRAMLTHLYPEWDDVNFANETAAFNPPCEVIMAEDGLKLNIPNV